MEEVAIEILNFYHVPGPVLAGGEGKKGVKQA